MMKSVPRYKPHVAQNSEAPWDRNGVVTFKYVEASGGSFMPAHPVDHWYGESMARQYHDRSEMFWDEWFNETR